MNLFFISYLFLFISEVQTVQVWQNRDKSEYLQSIRYGDSIQYSLHGMLVENKDTTYVQVQFSKLYSNYQQYELYVSKVIKSKSNSTQFRYLNPINMESNAKKQSNWFGPNEEFSAVAFILSRSPSDYIFRLNLDEPIDVFSGRQRAPKGTITLNWSHIYGGSAFNSLEFYSYK